MTEPRLQRRRIRPVLPALTIVLVALLAACTPTATDPGQPDSELSRVAAAAYHRMELGYLETGAYTTNALVDLELPRHVKWTLEEFSDDTYRLRFTADDRPGEAWLVSPAGVRAATSGG